MQQYRVNYTLLIGLLVGTLVCSSVVFGLWKFQIGRKSGWLIAEAEKARQEGKLDEAIKNYQQYLTIRGDDQVRLDYTKTTADLAEGENAGYPEFELARSTLERSLRDQEFANSEDGKDLRRRLIKLYGRDNVRRYPDALDHLSLLLQQLPNDVELQVMKTNYLFGSGKVDEAVAAAYKLIGYDPKTDAFDVKKATAPQETEVYANLAILLRGKQDKPELADRVMDQMVEVNPKMAKAYLARGLYRESTGDTDAAQEDIDMAYELDPKSPEVLLTVAGRAAKDEDYEQALEYVNAGKKLHPQDPRFYQLATDFSVKQNKYEEALKEVEEGLKTITGNKKNVLYILKADLQLHTNDVKGVKDTTEAMSKSGFRSEFIEWYDARLLLAENRWFAAVQALSDLRPKVAQGFGDLPQQIDNLRGLCYEKLGRPEQAAEQYRLVLQQDPGNAPAKAGLQRSTMQRGLKLSKDIELESNPFQEKLAEILELPKEKRNWAELDAMLPKIAAERKWDEATIKLNYAQLLAMREDFNGAAKAANEANKLAPGSLPVHRFAINLARINPEQGPEKALELWNRTAQKFTEQKDQPALRVDKAEILIALHQKTANKDELKAELAGLTAGIDNWTDQEKIVLWGNLARDYLNLGMTDEARELLTLSAEKQPQELPIRLALFQLALDSNDDEGMKEAQDKILEIVKDKNDNAWLYTEARRQLSLVRRGQLDAKALPEIRVLVNRALQQRKDWHELYVLNAELELLSNNVTSAMQNFDLAASLGRLSATSTAAHIRLLSAFGRFADAAKQLERLPEPLRQPLLGQLYPEILFQTNQVKDAIAQARTASEADPENPEKHYWYGQLMARAAQGPEVSDKDRTEGLKRAIDEMRKAVELQPEFPEAWYGLISYYLAQKDVPQAETVLRDAQLALSGENLQLFLAKGHELLGHWFDAETMYRTLYDAAPDDLARTQTLAAFYLGDAYQRPDKMQKVTPLINRILRAGSESKIPPNDPNLLWARRMGAKMLAATGDYQNLLKAENLARSNVNKDGALSLESKLELAEILAPRPDPVSRFKAIGLLEEVSAAQRLNEQAELVLGQLYHQVAGAETEGWRRYATHMNRMIARFPNSLQARATYVNNLLQRGDEASLKEATSQFAKINQLAPNSPATFDIAVRLANKTGKQQGVIAEIMRRMPKLDDPKALTAEQVQMLPQFARYLTELGDLDNAERIYRALVAINPNLTPDLAMFLGMHRDVEQCFATIRSSYSPERIPAILQVVMPVLREKRDQVSDKYDAEVQGWITARLQENPDEIQMQVVQADLYDLRKEYDKAADIYRKLLENKELTGMGRAIVLNNLAFLVALEGSAAGSNDDPLKWIQEATDIMGPNSEILDTRAVVYTARGNYQNAIQDLKLSVTENPTASKYYHKALAHLAAKPIQTREALDAWDKAEELGLDRDKLNRMEFDQYEKTKAQIEQLRASSVTRAEPKRRAG